MNTTPTNVFVPKKERRTQFRGRSIETGEWIFGYLVVSENTHTIWKDGVSDDGRTSLFGYDVNEETVGQSTGIYDSKGSLIYEGDIVRFGVKEFQAEEAPISEVFWHYELGAFVVDYKEKMMLNLIRDVAPVEIIGNIHDDKELIDEETI